MVYLKIILLHFCKYNTLIYILGERVYSRCLFPHRVRGWGEGKHFQWIDREAVSSEPLSISPSAREVVWLTYGEQTKLV